MAITRKRRGKAMVGDTRSRRASSEKPITAQDVLKVYQREVDRKRLLTRKADVASNRLLFVTEALRHLLKDDNFNTLLRAEGLTTFPKPPARIPTD